MALGAVKATGDGLPTCVQNPTGASWTFPWYLEYSKEYKEWTATGYNSFATIASGRCGARDASDGIIMQLSGTDGANEALQNKGSNKRNVYRVEVESRRGDIITNRMFYFWVDHSSTCEYCFYMGPHTQIKSIRASINN